MTNDPPSPGLRRAGPPSVRVDLGKNGKRFKFSKFVEIFRSSLKFFRNLPKRGSKFIEIPRNFSKRPTVPEAHRERQTLWADECGPGNA